MRIERQIANRLNKVVSASQLKQRRYCVYVQVAGARRSKVVIYNKNEADFCRNVSCFALVVGV